MVFAARFRYRLAQLMGLLVGRRTIQEHQESRLRHQYDGQATGSQDPDVLGQAYRQARSQWQVPGRRW